MLSGALALGLLSAAQAQTATQQPSGDAAPAERPLANVGPEYSRVRPVPDEVLNRKPRQVVILPADPVGFGEDRILRTGGAIARLPAELHRLPEGYMVAAREARIEKSDPWHLAHLVPAEGLPDVPPLRLLPNRRLALLESILDELDREPRFVLTGRVTEFMGVNYLMIEMISESTGSQDRRTDTPEPRPAADPDAERSSESDGTDDSFIEPTAEEILEELLRERPLRAVVFPEQAEEADTSDASADTASEQQRDPETDEIPVLPEGTMLSDRYGRIIEDDDGWLFVLENQGSRPRDATLRILPGRLLEAAIAISGTQRDGVVLQVTGEITVYHGRNYLLLRKVVVRKELGNLR